MMPDGDTAAHLRKQVGGLFLYDPLDTGAILRRRQGRNEHRKW
jgi:hypothetical protein